MKLIVAIGLLTLSVLSQADELSDCKCWEGYEPVKNEDGVRCHGKFLKHIAPCNIPRAPRCRCSGHVNGILTDDSGTWCAEYGEGVQLRKWECENREEWEKFFEENPSYRRH